MSKNNNKNLIILMVINLLTVSNGIPIDNDDLNTYNNDEPIASHDISGRRSIGHFQTDSGNKKTIVDLSSADADDVFKKFNVSREYVWQRTNQNPNITSMVRRSFSNDSVDEVIRSERERFRMRVASRIDRSSTPLLNEPRNNAVHSFALYPLCSRINESWLDDDVIKLYFSTSIFDKINENTWIRSAQLRLKQIDPDQSPVNESNCADPSSLIRITVSVMVKKNSRDDNRDEKYRKKICHSFTTTKLNSKDNNWLTIDVSEVIKHWRNNLSNISGRHVIPDPKLTIEVEDQEENRLKAGLFFEPYDCQAGPAIPWDAYGNLALWNRSEVRSVPGYPRLDIIYSSTKNRTDFYSDEPNPFNYHRNYNRMDSTYNSIINQNQHPQEQRRVHRKRHIRQHNNHRLNFDGSIAE